jgi:WD40 repeat protein
MSAPLRSSAAILGLLIGFAPPSPAAAPRPSGAGEVVWLTSPRLRAASPITGLAFSPDERLLATADSDGQVTLWDVATGQERLRLDAGFPAPSVAFSTDGTRLVAASSAGPVRLWRLPEGKLVWTAWGEGRKRKARGGLWLPAFASFLPDGKGLLVCHAAAADPYWPTLEVLDAATGKSLRRIERALDTSPCRHALAGRAGQVAVCMYHRVWLHDLHTGKALAKLGDGDEKVECVAIDSGARSVALGKGLGIDLVDRPSGKRTATLGPRVKISSLAFTGEDRWLVGLGEDQRLRVWDVRRRALVRTIEARGGTQMAVTPRGGLAAVASGCVVRLWDLQSGKEQLPRAVGHTSSVKALAYSPDGAWLGAGNLHEPTRLHPLRAGLTERTLPTPATHLRFAPDGTRLLAVAGFDSGRAPAASVWDVETGREQAALELPGRGELHDFAFTPGGKSVLLVLGGSLRRHDAATGRTEHVRSQPRGDRLTRLLPATQALISTDRSGGQGQLRVLDLDTGAETGMMLTPGAGQSPFDRMLPSPAGDVVVLGRRGGALAVVEVCSGSVIRRRHRPGRSLTAVAISPNGRFLGLAEEAHFWLPWGWWDRLAGAALRNGPLEWLLSPSRYSLHLCDLATGKEACCPWVPRTSIDALAFSPDGRTLAWGQATGAVALWRLPPAPAAARPGRAERERLWQDLGGRDAAKAYAARLALARHPDVAVELFHSCLRPVPAGESERLRRLLTALDGEGFQARQQAEQELLCSRPLFDPGLRRALADKPSIELHYRLLKLLAAPVPPGNLIALRCQRALALLESINSPTARRLLARLARGAPEALQTALARAALERRSHWEAPGR